MHQRSSRPYVTAFLLAVLTIALAALVVFVDAKNRERSGPFLHITYDDQLEVRLQRVQVLSFEIVTSSVSNKDRAIGRLESIGYYCESFPKERLRISIENDPSLGKLGTTTATTCSYELDMLGNAMKVLIFGDETGKVVHHRAFIYRLLVI